MLAGRVALVTGSTSGIGAGIAQCLAAQGAHVMLNGFGERKQIDTLQDSIASKYGVRVAYDDADLSCPSSIRRMVQRTQAEFKSLDILVNNAGIQHVCATQDFPDQQWDNLIAVNLSACFHSVKASLPMMQKKNFGRIINIASAHGLVGSANKSAYVAAKHGVLGFTKAVALENAGTGITANSVCPGWVLTPLVQAQIEKKAQEQNISVQQATDNLLAEKQPSKQFVTPEQLGSLVSYLCSEEAAQITGTSMSMDGGWTAQ